MDITIPSSNAATVATGKRSYQTPKLTRYGDVRVLTQSGSGVDVENVAQAGPPVFCTGNVNKRSCTSDRAAKHNIEQVGWHPWGFGIYLFDYKPEYREKLGSGRQFGVMADEVEAVVPMAVHMQSSGLKAVDYELLGIRQFS